ncbi:Gastrokine-1 [Heterocephalus glaber]|uniref:Gastrokine-1 n=1 Tax=Heterocephalus glaber TaxID=10181 RepID=G5BNY9_HETGA|nr:Gastrokine-1 [Heterocephalus glaber]
MKFTNINVNDNNNVAGSGQQSVSINNEHNVANVDYNNGWDSWNSLWDYENGFAATRLFAKKSCIVHKMNNEVMPSLQALDALVKEKKLQAEGPGGLPPKALRYSINSNPVDDLNKFGQNIVGMCQGLPTYLAEEIPGTPSDASDVSNHSPGNASKAIGCCEGCFIVGVQSNILD